MRRIAVHFSRLGPYHIARIGAAVRTLQAIDWEVIALEIAGTDKTYLWRQELQKMPFSRVTVFPDDEFGQISSRRLALGVNHELDRLKPAAVAICGYADAGAREALRWCQRHRALAILMTETRRVDSPRVWWKEWLKSKLVRRFDSALCAGVQHRDYLIELGMPNNRIHLGYDVVDNQFFATEASRFRQQETVACGPYFLSSNRFIPRKNLLTLIAAYHKYAQFGGTSGSRWPLVLLGDGEQKAALLERCRGLALPVLEHAPWENGGSRPAAVPVVYFPGFRQIEELPRFYAHAGCLIHPAITEPWGLVVNEAMACSLPVLASHGTEAALNLVEDGVNGWCFDAGNDAAIAKLMATVSELSGDARSSIGEAARRTVDVKCPLAAFGRGLAAAIESASKHRD